MTEIKRTERGWPGHFIGASRCNFRRNTLIECGDVRVIVTSVGAYMPDGKPEYIGYQRYYETMAFPASFDGRYWDADHSKEISIHGEWATSDPLGDDTANNIHEAVVDEFMGRITSGETFQKEEAKESDDD